MTSPNAGTGAQAASPDHPRVAHGLSDVFAVEVETFRFRLEPDRGVQRWIRVCPKRRGRLPGDVGPGADPLCVGHRHGPHVGVGIVGAFDRRPQ
jgi:hypothetical protein